MRIIGQSIQPSHTTYPIWWAVANLSITLFGVIFLGWSLEPIVFIFWMEVIFAIGAVLIRGFFALEGHAFFSNILHRLFIVGAGAMLGIGFIMLTVAFTINALGDGEGFVGSNPRTQVFMLFFNYLAVLVLHYFYNGRYRTANPIMELMSTFVYLLVLLCLIMVLTMHLLPKFKGLDQALWVGLSVVGVKFTVDLIFGWINSRQVLGNGGE